MSRLRQFRHSKMKSRSRHMDNEIPVITTDYDSEESLVLCLWRGNGKARLPKTHRFASHSKSIPIKFDPRLVLKAKGEIFISDYLK